MAWIRLLIGAAGLAAAGAATARRVARASIEDHKRQTLEWAEAEARRRIRAEGAAFERKMLRRLLVSSLIKAGLLSLIFAVFFLGGLTASQFALAAGLAVAGFMGRDLYTAWPELRLAYTEMRKHRWRVESAVGEAVAMRALASALETANAAELDWRGKLALAVAGVDKDALGRELAQSVAEIARSMAWSELRPYARSTAIKIIGGSVVYAAFSASIFAAAGLAS